jgi:glycerol-3-phosphate dehydrogenase (NAD(P)+)
MAIVTIVGAGFMGTATAWPLSDNGHTVRLVGTHLDRELIASCKANGFHPRLKRTLPSGVRPYFVEELATALEGAEVVLSGVNSLGVRWLARTVGPLLRPRQQVIAITKGLDLTLEGDLVILPDLFRSELPARIRETIPMAAIGGPCIAGELAGRRPTCVVFGSREKGIADELAALFRTAYYHVWTTTDLTGLEYCAALKNAYTLGVGLALGLLEKQGGPDPAGAHLHNLAAAAFGQACTEMARMLEVVGGSPQFAYGLPGAGDLYVTCTGGRTVRLGALLGSGHSLQAAREILAGQTLESAEVVRVLAAALPRLVARQALGAEELPLLRTLIDVMVRGRPLALLPDAFFGGQGRV